MAALPVANRRIRVLLADDHPVVRRMAPSTFQAHPHIEVVAEAEDGAQAVEQARETRPDVAVLNITMPFIKGFQAASEIKNTLEPAIVILSTHADRHFVEEGRKLGARAYVSKSKVARQLSEP